MGGASYVPVPVQLIHTLPCGESTPWVVCHQLNHKVKFKRPLRLKYVIEMDSSNHLFTVTVLMHVHVETETVPLIAYTHQTVLQTFYTL